MREKTATRNPGRARIIGWLLVVALLPALSGCFSNRTVTYTPPELRGRPMQDGETVEALKQYYSSWQGTRYVHGGLSHNGVDCSGFALLAYKELFGRSLPRTVQEQLDEGTKISKTALQPGDLVFFKTGLYQRHVGIYLQDDLFIHASPSRGVTVSSLNNLYWRKRFWQAQRL